ncbi:MAG: carbohydrate ABC transporter permease [Clostridia bacterium]|nr:carbohydrate ABC transporter permease [Clostridia bacterium]
MKNIIDTFSNMDSRRAHQLRKKGASLVYSIFRLVILLSIGFIIIYPLMYTIVTSLQSKYAFLNSTRVWIPTEFAIAENYAAAFNAMEYMSSLWSTFKNELLSAAIEIASCALVAYGLARFDFKLKKFYTAILFLTILVPEMMILIPRMLNYSHLDLFGILGLFNNLTGIDLRPNILDSVWAFWLPSIFGVGLRSGILIYIYIQFFKGLPKELEEAAWVDGAGPFKTFLAIALPSSGVVILTVTVFAMIWHWNDSLLSGMYLSEEFPLAQQVTRLQETLGQKYLVAFNGRDPQAIGYLMAGCVLFIVPMLVVYMIVQRWFIESIDRVGITG